MRKSLIIGGSIVAIGAAVASVPYFLDWNWVKPVLVAAAEDATGHEVEVTGEVGFDLFPRPALSAEGVRIKGAGPDAGLLLTAESLGTAVAFWPLFSKRIEVEYVKLDAPVVRLVSYADGTTNWEPAEASQDDADSGDGGLTIDDFRVSNGTLIQIAGGTETRRIDDIDMRFDVAGKDGPYRWDGSLLLDGLPLDLVGEWGGDGRLILDVAADGAAELHFAGRAGKDDAGAMTLTGQVEAEGAALRGVMALISPDGEPADAAAWLRPFRVKSSVSYLGDMIVLDDVSGTVGGSKLSGRARVSLRERVAVKGDLSLDRLDVADWQRADDGEFEDQPFELPDMTADMILSVDDLRYGELMLGGVNAPVRLADGKLTLGRTRLSLPAGGAALFSAVVTDADGVLAATGEFTAALPKPAATLSALGVDRVAAMPALKAKGGFAYGAEGLTLSGVSGVYDGRPFRAAMTLPADEAKPVQVALRTAALDYDRIQLRESEEGGDDEARPVRFELNLGTLGYGGERYSGIAAQGLYQGSLLTLDRAVLRDLAGFDVRAAGTVADVGGENLLDVSVRLAGEQGEGGLKLAGPLARFAVSGTMGYAGADVSVSGDVATSPETEIALNIGAKAADAGAVLAALNEEPQTRRLGPLDMTMTLSGAEGRYRLSNIGGKLGPMALSGVADVDVSGDVPGVNARLEAGVVPLDVLMGADADGAETAEAGGARWSSEHLDLGWISTFDGKVSLSAKRLDYGNYKLMNPQLSMVSTGDVLTVETLKGGVFTGSFSVSGRIRALAETGTSVALKLNMADVPLTSFMEASTASAPATGTLTMTADIVGQGASQRAVMGSLSGPVRVSATNGVVRKIDLAKLDRELGDLRSVGSFLRFASAALEGGETRYRRIDARLRGTGGRFRIEGLTTDMDGGSATGSGYVDMGRWAVDMNADLRLGSHADAPRIPVRIAGALPSPEVDYRLGPLQGWFAKRAGLVALEAVLGGGESSATPGIAGDGPDAGDVAETKPKSMEEELGDALVKGLGSLLGGKKD